MWTNLQKPRDLFTFTKEIVNGKLHYESSAICCLQKLQTDSPYILPILSVHCIKSVRIRSYSGPYFPNSDWMRRDTEYFSVFSANEGKYRPDSLRKRTLFMHWLYLRVLKVINKSATLSNKSRFGLQTTLNMYWPVGI